MGNPEEALPMTHTENPSEPTQPDWSSRKFTWGDLVLIVACWYGGLYVSSALYSGLFDDKVAGTNQVHLSDEYQWVECGKRTECTRITVPLDYHNTSSGTTTLAVARVRAKNQKERRGTLFTNPGGPGGSGVEFVTAAGRLLADLLEERWDIVSWDPRGVGNTEPQVKCFTSQTAQDLYKHLIIPAEIGDITSPVDTQFLKNQYRMLTARHEALTRLCEKETGDALRFMSTPYVVRDLDYLARKLDGDKPINFWGYSYGTIVGNYLVNMFPDRIGHVVLDGVVDPLVWTQTPSYKWGKPFFVDFDKTWRGFLKSCIDGTDNCPLSAFGQSIDELDTKVKHLLYRLFLHPEPVPDASIPGVLTSGDARQALFMAMYRPRIWPQLAQILASALAGDFKPGYEFISRPIELDTSVEPGTEQSTDAIMCADSHRVTIKDQSSADVVLDDVVNAMVEVINGTSGILPGSDLDESFCFHWKVEPKEKFDGPFNSTGLSNKVLIIGNTADPVTPLHSAKVVHSLLGSNQSTLLTQNGYGHCSLAQTSTCTWTVLQGYFLEDKLPGDGVVCEVDEPVFPIGGKESVESWLVEDASEEGVKRRRIKENARELGRIVGGQMTKTRRRRW
jgi:pimeloyl-ACP methyl ester carboxylesterase